MYEIATDLSRKIYEGEKFSDRDYSYDVLPVDDYYTNGRIYDYDFLTAQKDMADLVNTDVIGKPMQIAALVHRRAARQPRAVRRGVRCGSCGERSASSRYSKESRSTQGPRAGTKSDSEPQLSKISISDFLRIVNSTY